MFYFICLFEAVETKILVDWTDYGACVAIGNNVTCGLGIQQQTRNCVDGSIDHCQETDARREVSCNLKPCSKVYGNWTDDGSCTAVMDKAGCGPGKRNQTRVCEDGTIDKCADSEIFQVVGCRLPDCPKVLGEWDKSGPCKGETAEKLCGPGIQYQNRTCLDGTSDNCTYEDKNQDVRCSLPDCIKVVGNWSSAGPCESLGDYKKCGRGEMRETRDCIDGTKDSCTNSDIERHVTCNLPSCFLYVGNWTDDGSCVGTGERKNCGAGVQRQVRSCVDGFVTKCTAADKEQQLSCTLPDCNKELGHWVNAGECVGLINKQCGQGNQLQTRTCTDGTHIECAPTDMARTIICNLPECQKIFGSWENVGECIASGSDKNCGPGERLQIRSCVDGTIDKCTQEDQQHSLPCNLRDCHKLLGSWTNDGGCIASDTKNPCGPLSSGSQKQIRTCIDGTTDQCQSNDTERTVPCDVPNCAGNMDF